MEAKLKNKTEFNRLLFYFMAGCVAFVVISLILM